MVLALVVAPRRYGAGCGDLKWHSVAHTCSIATFFFVHDRDFKICFNANIRSIKEEWLGFGRLLLC